jgi:hypothetical protein
MRRAWHHRAAPYLWFLSVTVLSFLPGSLKGHLFTRSVLHVPAHACIFAISALMACRNVRTAGGRIVPAIAVAAYGCTIEALQASIFKGPVEWDDIATDICGVLATMLLAAYADTLRKENPDLL